MYSVNAIDIITVFSYNSNKFRREEIGGVNIKIMIFLGKICVIGGNPVLFLILRSMCIGC